MKVREASTLLESFAHLLFMLYLLSLFDYLLPVDDEETGREVGEGMSGEEMTLHVEDTALGGRCVFGDGVDALDIAAQTTHEAGIDVLAVVVEVPDADRGVGTPAAVGG